MAKIKDIAGGFFNDNTIYSPNGYTQARKVSNAIVDRNISDMQNEIQQGENIGAEARKDKKEDGKSSIAELTGNKKVVEGKGLPKPKTSNQKTTIKKETLVNPDNVSSGATATPADNSTPGTKEDPNAKYGRKANEPAPTADLPMARAGLFEDQKNAEQTLANKRKERDEFIKTAKQDKKTAKRNIREQSIMSDDFDLDDAFDSTDPFVASLFKKSKINKLLKDQIKEQYPDQIAEITERIKNDPDYADLSGRERCKLINAEVTKFVEPLWKEAGGDTQVNSVGLFTPVVDTIKKTIYDNADESTKKVLNDKRAALEKKQNRSLVDQIFLDTFNMIEKGIDTEKKTAELKGEVKNARNNLSTLNAELRGHNKAVDKARSNFYKDGDIETKITHKNGWTFFDRGKAHYAAQVEDHDGKKKYVIYSVTEGSPDTQRDPVWEFDYQDYNGTNNTNEKLAIQRIEGDKGQVEGGTKGRQAAVKEASDKQTFETLDGQNYFDYIKAHKIIAPKILKLIIDRGGKIDRNTGKVYSVSNGDFPEGADELYVDYSTALKLAKGDDEEVAKLTGMSLDEVKARKIIGMTRDYSVGDARVVVDDQGRAVYQLPDDNKTVLGGANGRSFYINWNNPENRKVVDKYVKLGKTKQDIPLSELKTVNTSRSSEGNADWTDKDKTKAAEKAQKAKYTGAYKPSADILNALIGFGRK